MHTMSLGAKALSYPYVTRNPGILAGEPVIEGTRIPVSVLVRAHQLGLDFDEILTEYPGLIPTHLHAAFLYYHDHKDEIEAIIEENQKPPPGSVVLGDQ